jgi:RNase H-like domain found in reverse transcriptase
MAKEPVTKTFRPEAPITIETDASDFAVAACLSQPDEQGRMHPVMFYSRTPERYNIFLPSHLRLDERVFLPRPNHVTDVQPEM